MIKILFSPYENNNAIKYVPFVAINGFYVMSFPQNLSPTTIRERESSIERQNILTNFQKIVTTTEIYVKGE
jgi:hypothetical protein